jgi:hypothetical protein
VEEGGQQDSRKKVIAPSYDIEFECSTSQIEATRVGYLMVGVDRKFSIQGWGAGAESELVPEGGQQDST